MVAYLGEDFLDTEWGLGSDIIFDIRFHCSGKFTELLHVLNRDRLHFHLYFLICVSVASSLLLPEQDISRANVAIGITFSI